MLYEGIDINSTKRKIRGIWKNNHKIFLKQNFLFTDNSRTILKMNSGQEYENVETEKK